MKCSNLVAVLVEIRLKFKQGTTKRFVIKANVSVVFYLFPWMVELMRLPSATLAYDEAHPRLHLFQQCLIMRTICLLAMRGHS